MNQHNLQISSLSSGYDKKIIVDDVSLIIPSGEITVIVGANACGKSTLLKTIARLIKPKSGDITLDNKSINKYDSKEFAKVVGILPQSPIVPEGISVSDLVGRGRYPHQSLLGGLNNEDYKAINEAMEVMGIKDIENRNIDELSGGQRQRVWIAMALAQKTDILFLDEPTTYLDITYQIEILDLLYELNKKYGITIVMVLHDINLSCRYSNNIIAMKEGKVFKQGKPKEIITEELVKNVFDLECKIILDPISNTPLIIPNGKFQR